MLSEGSIFNGDETFNEEPIIAKDKEEFSFLSGQRNTIGQTSKVVTQMETQTFILMKIEEVVSPRNWICDKEEDSEGCIEFLGEIPSQMEDLWHKLSILEKRIENQRIGIQTIQLELNKNQ